MRVWGCVDKKEGAYVFLTLPDVAGVGVGLSRYQRKGPMSSLL